MATALTYQNLTDSGRNQWMVLVNENTRDEDIDKNLKKSQNAPLAFITSGGSSISSMIKAVVLAFDGSRDFRRLLAIEMWVASTAKAGGYSHIDFDTFPGLRRWAGAGGLPTSGTRSLDDVVDLINMGIRELRGLDTHSAQDLREWTP